MRKVWLLVLAVALCCPMVAGAGEVSSKWDVNIYGYIKLDAVYQNSYAIMDNFLVQVPPGNLCQHGGNPFGACVPNEQDNSERDSFHMTARQSRFGLLITTPATDSGLITRGRLEMDFYGSLPPRAVGQDVEENKGGLMLRRATVEIIGSNWEILAGNEWMVMSPIFPHVNNYPYGADAGNLGYRTPQIRLTGYALDKSLILQVAATNKMGDVDTLDIDTGRMTGTPAYEGGITFKRDGFNIGFTGHWGQEEIQTVRDGSTAYYGSRVDSWSYNFHAIIPMGDRLAVSGELWQGANLDGWYTGNQGSGWVIDDDGDRVPVEGTGWWVELMIKATDSLKLHGGWGVDDADDEILKDSTIEPGYLGRNGNVQPTRNIMYYGNCYYNVSPSTMISFEWMQMATEYDNMSGWDNAVADRYTMSFWYIF